MNSISLVVRFPRFTVEPVWRGVAEEAEAEAEAEAEEEEAEEEAEVKDVEGAG